MAGLDRFSTRHYYETRFKEDESLLWLWETNIAQQAPIYVWKGFAIVQQGEMSYSNNLFIPADFYTTESTPDYFLVDIYGISAGGYSGYRSDKHHHGWNTHYDDHYFGGGSGACLFLGNVKIRLKDEDLKKITYTMSGKRGPADTNYNIFQINPVLVNNNLGDWKLSLSGDYRTPNGIAPSGTTILAMSSGGNASAGSYSVGNGANRIYVPTKSATKVDIADLPVYTAGDSYTIGQYINYNGTAYRVIANFTATNWTTDVNNTSPTETYSDSVTFNAGYYLYDTNGDLYRVDKTFTGDKGNSLYGFADYFLAKDLITSNIQRTGRNGTHTLDGKHWTAGGEPNRIYTAASINETNEIWMRRTLSWGKGQDSYRRGSGGQGGGLVMIYHGETN